MVRTGQLILTIVLPIWLPASSADTHGACQLDGTCKAAQGASMLQAKSQRGKIAVVESATEKRARAKHRRARTFVHNGKLLSTGHGNWMAGAWGNCTKACDPPVKERTVECKPVWDGQATHECAHIEPIHVMKCSCDLEACDDAPLNDCTPTEEEGKPSLPGALQTAHYTLVGCFELEPGDSAEAGDFMDLTCMEQKEAGCRSGVPFFRNTTATTVEACSMFCLAKGLDIFGIVSESECRCGASKLNAEVFHEADPPPHLVFDPTALNAFDDFDEICPLQVYRYTGFFDLGGIPLSLLKPNVATSAYIDSIVAGHIIKPEEEEDKGGKDSSLVQKKAPWDRPCYPQNCGAGRGPWNDRRSNGPDDPAFVDKFEEYVWVPYWFTGAVDQTRKEAFTDAAKMWLDTTCIVPYEKPGGGYGTGLRVDVVDTGSCWVQGMGNGGTVLNLGWCKDTAHVGNMAHEIGHALGMMHEQSRLDAQQKIDGHGPFLDIHWDNISPSWKSQYAGKPNEYMGSSDQGTDDPHAGYAPYDFGSIMHYPGGDSFDTIPAQKELFVGNRAKIQHSDIMQIWDMYQCNLKPGFTPAPTPAPAEIIAVAGACEVPAVDFNGDYVAQGTTESGATWYKRPGKLALYFDPSCNGQKASARWVLDNDGPDTTATSDLDLDGGCTYWGKTETTQTTVPESASWRIYCPDEGGWVSKTLKIGDFPPTPAPPPPTPGPPTPAPTLPVCIGNAATWNGGWGGCITYKAGAANAPYCKMDSDGGKFASEVCEVCGECLASDDPTPAPAPTPDPWACQGDHTTWDAGFGGCEVYSSDQVNSGYCELDKDGGLSAAKCCPECNQCTLPAGQTASTTTAEPSPAATLTDPDLRCKDKIGGKLKKVTVEDCSKACSETTGCTRFSHQSLNGGKWAPGVCVLTKKCKKAKQKKTFMTYTMD